MYAMFQKQSEGIQLYLRQAPHEITATDGVDNNILHLAFPLPAKYFKQESHRDTENVLELVGANVGIEGAKQKTFEAIRAIITEKTISVEDKITALTQLSASNFTPVSLAAATGYVEIYEFLIRFLKANNAWNEDDHSHLGIRVNELMVSGLKTYKASREKHDNLSSFENNKIAQEIEERENDLSKVNHTCIREIYHPESSYATKLLKVIRKPAMDIMDDFYAQKGTKRKTTPYDEALNAAMDEMTNPKPTIEKELIPVSLPTFTVPDPEPVEAKKKSLWKKNKY